MFVKSENMKEEAAKCHICLKEFANFELEVHLIEYHNKIDSKELIGNFQEKCEFCELVISKTKIATHLKKTHKDALHFKCDICGKSFHKETILNRQ